MPSLALSLPCSGVGSLALEASRLQVGKIRVDGDLYTLCALSVELFLIIQGLPTFLMHL